MLEKIRAATAKAGAKLDQWKVSQAWEKLSGWIKEGWGYGSQAVDMVAARLYKMKVSANVVSIIGFIIGLLAINFLSLEKYGYALICIVLNRLFDALDGAIARHSQTTDFGIFLDATLDYIFYAGVIFGFALANPVQNAIPATFLLFAFTSAACAMLAYAVVAYKKDNSQKLALNQSPFYLGGFAQGFETLVALVIMCIVPSWFLQIAIILGVLSFVKALSVVATAYYSFVVVEKAEKK